MNKLLLCFLLFFPSLLLGQTNQLEAKAAYMLAEEAFAASNYPATLNYLETAVTKLGGANSKILYLKIMAQQELSKTDKRYLAKLDSTIADFEKAPDVANFNEEKVLEVIKLKMQIKQEADAVKNSTLFNRDGWTFGTSLDALKIKKPEFFENISSTSIPGYGELVNKNAITQPGISILYVSKNILYGYGESLFSMLMDDGAFSKGKAQIATLMERIKGEMVSAPVEKTFPPTGSKECRGNATTYTWERGSKKITLTFITTAGRSCNTTSSATLTVVDEALK